ncbi:class I SAM-dependent methyltransferase [Mycolicibacterium aubagnense]|uniref:Methyltransferase n=1 Tax=Mycolicibacterium aubagnense TaxID=319707 RepID=A0ABN5YZZ3_9MYCO|nr:class I SAM-dependent methyltransferase [Mycolicibacterium aubagnense]TLH65276.1 class I SAM-dependent methyltransferase [Mycolicibacterium aubagnense]WGI31121.1 class I SAM-dependent methyltransferase [Mycolicibacterium aubagnense]BBX87492.1 methyltransferase [Mycolicibacterium aubagnense]
MEPDFVTLTRDGYDRSAAHYVARFQRHLDDRPVDRAMIGAFAALVHPGTRVLDVGCGTGVATAALAVAGLDVTGIDLSPNMIAQARRHNPGLSFRVGSMLDLDVSDCSVGGLCAWYSIIHVPDTHLPAVFAEFHRVLAPGGVVLLAFQVGEEPRVLTDFDGARVNLTFIRRQPHAVADLLSKSGFRVYAELVRQLDDGLESTPQAYLMARRAA